jgi:hypothetical protein
MGLLALLKSLSDCSGQSDGRRRLPDFWKHLIPPSRYQQSDINCR